MFVICNLCFRARQHLRSLAPIMNGLWWLCWPMKSGDAWGLSFTDICPTVEEKLRKISHTWKTDLTEDRTRARCVKGHDVTRRPKGWSFMFVLSRRWPRHWADPSSGKGPSCPCEVKKKYVCDPELIPSPTGRGSITWATCQVNYVKSLWRRRSERRIGEWTVT